jgi:endonuclease YncB( thermonuclease family)
LIFITKEFAMANALFSLGDNQVAGSFGLGMGGSKVFTPHQAVHDGDTFSVRALGNFGLRFLGIDTPEISFTLPGKRNFTPIENPAWEVFLSDPFAADYPGLVLDASLRTHLATKLGPGCATNHANHAKAAQAALQVEVEKDVGIQGQQDEGFKLFMRFASDITDRYGRLLAYVNRDEKDPQARPPSYNDRMLTAGFALPYFIWPNVDPFRQQTSLRDAVWQPGEALEAAQQAGALRVARAAVAKARVDGAGIFDAADSLRLEPFELRYLARRDRPGRWVMDLASTGNMLHHPQRYFEITRPEDRLYIDADHVTLFVEAGWVLQGI